MTQVMGHEAVQTYLDRTPGSRALYGRAARVMPGGETRTTAYWKPYPLFMARGEGCRIWDVDGNSYIDFVNNYTSLVLGHAHPAVEAAVAGLPRGGSAFAASLEEQVLLAERLVSRVPSLQKVRFCNSGTEATMFTLKAARALTGRDKFIKVEGGFHGTHDAVEVSVAPPLEAAGPAADPVAVGKSGITKAAVADCIVVPYGDLAGAARAFDRHGADIAALIIEPAPGGIGYPAPPDGYLAGLRDLTRSHGALLIFDEVQTLRLSEGGAQQRFGVLPDLTAMGKIIGGGYPVGGFGGPDQVMSIFDPATTGAVTQSGTFNGNRVTMAAGTAVLDVLDQTLIDRLNAQGEDLRATLAAAAAAAGVRVQLTGVGSLLNLHFSDRPVVDYRSAAAGSRTLSALFHLEMLNRGLFLAPRGMFNISAPMTRSELEACGTAAEAALRAMRPAVAAAAPHLLS